jgi:hypothetical protein
MVDDPKNFPHVRVVSCGLKNAANYEEDKAARAAIRTSLVESGDSMSHIEFARELELDIDVYGGTQSAVWAWLAAMNVGNQDDDTTIVCGYIRGDDFWHTKSEWEWTVDYMVKLANPKGVHFMFPLEWTTKKENVAKYLKHPSVFYKLSWVATPKR